MDNVICSDKNFIAGLSEEFKADLHQHPVLEIYAACDGSSHVKIGDEIVSGQIITIGPDAVHAIADDGKRGLAVFIDPLSEMGYSMKEELLRGDAYGVSYCDDLTDLLYSLLQNETHDDVYSVSKKLVFKLRGKMIDRPFDDPVLEALRILSEEDENFTMEALASKVFLSKSRLAHLFSEQTGITLKSYIQYKRLEEALLKIMSGSNITEAAMDTGFSGSSHISVSGRKLTGMRLRNLLNL